MNLRLRLRDVWRKILTRFGVSPYLCRTCRYNNVRDCRFRKRPYVTICEDYRRK